MHTIKTTCPYCGVGCGVEVDVDEKDVTVRGDQSHPANLGRLCSKGAALATTLDLNDRLLQPSIAGKPTDWETSLNLVADKFTQAIARYGSDSVAFYVSGQLLTEDYYVANKLMKGFIGSGNIDTNSRLCMSSSVVGHKRAFGSDTVPGCYEDWEQCDLIILTGSNTAWCHPVLFQRLVQAKKDNPHMQVVVIDPRKTSTCDIADIHLDLKSGTDAFLFSGLLHYLHSNGVVDHSFVEQHTEGLKPALDAAELNTPNIQITAQSCGLNQNKVARFYQLFAQTEKTITVYSQGINQSSSGSDKVNAIINCHLLTGRIGKEGMGPFSVTGQPNAMGGREVGALSNQLAAHMEYENQQDIDRVARFWNAKNISTKPGLKAIDLFQQIKQGKIKCLWVMATNPAVSMPDAGLVKQALASCEFLVVSDCVAQTDTSQYADVLLPALTWGEKSGTVTNSERRISRQRSFLDAPGAAKADWWIISRVAQKMGFDGFDYQTNHDIFKEHAKLSSFENQGSRDFDLTGLCQINQQQYDEMQPIQWPVKTERCSQQRLFTSGGFFHPNKKAKFISIKPQLPLGQTSEAYPLVLNTGRVRDHWHTMTRTGKSARLSIHKSEPYVQINPKDAAQKDIQQGQLLEVESQYGKAIVRIDIDPNQRQGNIFIPMHWNQQNTASSGVGELVNPLCDPCSGQPEFKHTPVNIRLFKARWHGFILSREKLKLRDISYWVEIKRAGCWQYFISGKRHIENWQEFRHDIFDQQGIDNSWSEILDSTRKSYRCAQFKHSQLQHCLFINTDYELPKSDWLISLFAKPDIERAERLRILAAEPNDQKADEGQIVCSCFSVGEKRIEAAIKNHDLKTASQIGEKLQAGTNCGSCIPELNSLLKVLNEKV